MGCDRAVSQQASAPARGRAPTNSGHSTEDLMRTAHRIGSVLISLICATACNLPDDVLEPDRAQAGAAGADAEGDPGGSTGGTGAVDPGANGGGEDGEDGEDDDAKGGKAATGGKGNSAPEPGDDEEPAEPGPGPANPGAVLEEASRGSAVALSSDESLGVIVNRDVGSISVLKLDTSSAGRPAIVSTTEVDLGKSSEPWQVVIAPDGDTAFVVLRREQKIVRVRYLSSEPRVDGSCNVGSEPTSIALTPTGKYAYVTNWNDGNLSVFDTSTLEKLPDIDLNPALVATGYLGEVAPRAALAHPRSIIISNDLDDSDEDESLYVTEYFGQQAEAAAADGSNADTRNVGILYKVALATGTVKTIRLSPLSDMGFKDANNQDAGCYPNQVQSIALNGPYAYVVSVCWRSERGLCRCRRFQDHYRAAAIDCRYPYRPGSRRFGAQPERRVQCTLWRARHRGGGSAFPAVCRRYCVRARNQRGLRDCEWYGRGVPLGLRRRDRLARFRRQLDQPLHRSDARGDQGRPGR
jgi:YVTN family beta-propeller protein